MRRLASIDGLKLLAAVITFFFHCHIHLGVSFGKLTAFISQGAIVMDLFFMLSGFALYRSYQEQVLNKADVLRFYGKRILSIYPLYLLIMAAHLFFPNSGTPLQIAVTLPVELLLLQSWFSGLFSWSHNGGTWFVSCLAFGYLMFPELLRLIRGSGARLRWVFLLITYILCGSIPAVVVLLGLPNVYSNQLLRLLQFIAGMLLASVLSEREKKPHTALPWALTALVSCFAGVGAVSLLVGMGFLRDQYVSYGFITFPLFLLLLAGTVMTETACRERAAAVRVLTVGGAHAYAMFMAQFFIWDLVRTVIAKYPQMFETCANVKTVLLASLLQDGFNAPCQRAIRKLKLREGKVSL